MDEEILIVGLKRIEVGLLDDGLLFQVLIGALAGE